MNVFSFSVVLEERDFHTMVIRKVGIHVMTRHIPQKESTHHHHHHHVPEGLGVFPVP